MSSGILQSEYQLTQAPQQESIETYFVKVALKNGIWFFGIPSWLFGIADRGAAAFADGYLSLLEMSQILGISFLFIGWLCLKPQDNLGGYDAVTLRDCRASLTPRQHEFLKTARERMIELQDQHMISQEYVLPFPYICQIYHLLNLKHLEDVHSLSLSNLKVIKVSNFQTSQIGGTIKFQTVLESPMNPLRIWRQPIVEVELVLRTPYTVELRIPVYGDKMIIVLFNVLPLSDTDHKLFVDIYTDLRWPKPLLRALLHLASGLTLFEDLPYLRKLAKRNLDRLIQRNKASTHDTMRLFNRFVDLYGTNADAYEPVRLLSSAVAEN